MQVSETGCFIKPDTAHRTAHADAGSGNLFQRNRAFHGLCGKTFKGPVFLRDDVAILAGELQLAVPAFRQKYLHICIAVDFFPASVTNRGFNPVCSDFGVVLRTGESADVFF